MMTLRKPHLTRLVALCALALAGQAEASRTTMSTGYSVAGPQEDAQGYRNAVEAALGGGQPGYGSAELPAFNYVSNHQRFGSENDVAYHFTVEFEVTAALAGQWSFRAGVDFGDGGAMLLDDTVLHSSLSDMWWNGSWSGPGVLRGSAVLTEGLHTLHLYGLERCCDGYFTTQFSVGDGPYVTFSNNDGLQPVSNVPEPSSWAMLAAGAGVLAQVQRRRRQVAGR
ncbi:PEP-CTERM sorting domain-containing protein [Pseudoduganella armeniaca]|uniref:PEP-CTERM sorting domain-containing protein n=2 Tax=Pseudoduganella armeniaca TaxID=2072590 RepID=A0A2R4C477_9BURK|nr:PEP-CTERM sorting domain-containing protein [Pseudoduganella armeniaca]